MVISRRVALATCLWIVLLNVITPEELRDGRGFQWGLTWMYLYGIALAVLCFWVVPFKGATRG